MLAIELKSLSDIVDTKLSFLSMYLLNIYVSRDKNIGIELMLCLILDVRYIMYLQVSEFNFQKPIFMFKDYICNHILISVQNLIYLYDYSSHYVIY
jgi:hypothetical protein